MAQGEQFFQECRGTLLREGLAPGDGDVVGAGVLFHFGQNRLQWHDGPRIGLPGPGGVAPAAVKVAPAEPDEEAREPCQGGLPLD